MKKIKVGIVNYLNTRPLIYGIERSPIMDRIELIGNYPSNIAASLTSGSIDIGLVPVAVLPELEEKFIVSDYCISCFGEVASVCIFSEVPMEEIEEIYLDYQSRTSVELAKILLREYWKTTPILTPAPKDFIDRIGGKKAAVVIGDRALRLQSSASYIYDLGEAWKVHTGLPFVFAVWVGRNNPGASFIREFNAANGAGFDRLDEIIAAEEYPYYALDHYYQENIQYQLSPAKFEAIELFWEKIRVGEVVTVQVP